ncbi:VOC family protein [Amycolatopsis regifaucium]|uniref:Bleomycin resistance protein n=1 Tax=Amycolatopsis regifaucium TaxID=546365 RepID=A0A154M7Q9_9PSEU|nr:VOC family protein [Amycolatopsis regifaucium]KZB80661.1 bleomycin resistance protein [Amycolatopsis regifaucium]OKA03039.1 bleomycin resistance protein [Amycolatopsis regifaucium]SFH02021.1 Glyoxalase-like domain-containing protein [Amycolatopsis regifaucium]
MTATLHAVCIDANDPDRLTRFWAGILGWETDGTVLVPTDDTGFRIRFTHTGEKKSRKNHAHFDLTSTSAEDQRRTVAKAIELGGRHVDIGQRPEEEHVVLADPEGNEFCVIEPGNDFLAGCGFVGALACDGSQEVGYFWSKALDWPLVWDRDQETAIRSPRGGPKITWGGPPFDPKTAKRRVRFAVSGLLSDVDRLVSLGATRLGAGEGGQVEMADPDGNEFSVVVPG